MVVGVWIVVVVGYVHLVATSMVYSVRATVDGNRVDVAIHRHDLPLVSLAVVAKTTVCQDHHRQQPPVDGRTVAQNSQHDHPFVAVAVVAVVAAPAAVAAPVSNRLHIQHLIFVLTIVANYCRQRH